LPNNIWTNLQQPAFQNNASFGNFLEEVSVSWSAAFFPLALITILFSVLSVVRNFRISNLSFKLQSLILLLTIFVGIGYTVSTNSSSLSNNRRWAQVNQTRTEVVQNLSSSSSSQEYSQTSLLTTSSFNSQNNYQNSQNTLLNDGKSNSHNKNSVPNNQNPTIENPPIKIYTATAKAGDSSTVLVRQIIKDYYRAKNQNPDKGIAIFVENKLVQEQKPSLEIDDKIEISQTRLETEFEQGQKLEPQTLQLWRNLAFNTDY